jgi:hypothetical protein
LFHIACIVSEVEYNMIFHRLIEFVGVNNAAKYFY